MLIYANPINVANYGGENVVMSPVVGHVYCMET